MSSRALRKLQREEAEKKQLRALEEQDVEEESDENDTPPAKPLNAFDMLNDNDDEAEAHENDTTISDEDDQQPSNLDSKLSDRAPSAANPKRSKKKKGKKKGKALDANSGPRNAAGEVTAGLDEIDLALKSLSAQGRGEADVSKVPIIDDANAQLCRLLAVESKHLNAMNEMRRLFGNVVMENEDAPAAAARHRGRGPQQLDLAAALSAKYSPVTRGEGLKGLALKRNPLILGKEEWPGTTSGGLSMELVERLEDGTVEYRFVHNTMYQDVQKQFDSCVASMDPQRLITLAQYNPYHVSTILQVSEIAKQQGDNPVAGDLLERVLFTFGRSAHSSFGSALSEGKARLDFRRPENRELWLAAVRYATDLGQRGTWRTAYEWARLILSLDPEGDPYCMHKRLDQLAILGGQSEHYLQLAGCPLFKDDLWKDSPNVLITTALAQNKLKQAQLCRATLQTAIGRYPWVFTRLFQELNLSHIPKSIWGQMAQTDREKFETENYVLGAKDLWSIPEAISLLVEVAETAPSHQTMTDTVSMNAPITLEEARYAISSGRRELINLLPREFTNMKTTSSDPLPPTDDLPSYDVGSDSGPVVHDRALDDAYADLSDDEQAIAPAGNDGGAMAVPWRLLQSITGLPARLYPGSGARDGEGDAAPPDTAMREMVNQAVLLQRVAAEDPTIREEMQRPGGALHEYVDALDRGVQSGRERTINERPENNNEHTEFQQASDAQPELEVVDDETSISEPNRDLARDPNSATEASASEPSSVSNDEPLPAGADVTDEQLRRYLAGTGVHRLRELSDHHKAEGASFWETPAGQKQLEVYASRLRRLRDRKTRDFIMKYALPQGTSKEIAQLVEQRL